MILQLVSSVVLVIVGYLCVSFYYKNKKLKKVIRENMGENLDLATTDQLLEQFRKRHTLSYIMLIPSKDKYCEKFDLDIHNLKISDALGILGQSTRTLADFLTSNNNSESWKNGYSQEDANEDATDL